MTSFHLRGASPAKTRADAVVVGAVQGPKGVALADGADDVTSAYGRSLRPLLSTLGFTGKAGEVARIPTHGSLNTPLLVVVGLGKEAADPAAHLLAVRRAAGVAARSTSNAASVALALPAGDAALVRNVTEGYLLGAYTFGRYLSTSSDKKAGTVTVLSPVARRQEVTTAFEEAQVVAAAVGATRDWVNTPANDLTPPRFADEIKAAAKGTKVTVTVLDEKKLADLGCGGLLGVGGGSSAPPRLVELRYSPTRPVAHVALVGKGITFDSGGLTIKPGHGMETMKCDMAGAATVTPGDAGDRPARPARPGDGVRAASRRTWCPAPRCGPATCSPSTAAPPSRCSTPTPRAGWCSPTGWSAPWSRSPTRSSMSRPSPATW